MFTYPHTMMGMRAGAPSSGDPYYASVGLLLHFDGANGSTAITDSSSAPKAATVNGGAKISTAQSKFGGSSLLLSATADSLRYAHNNAFDPGSADFTLEAWVYQKSTGGTLGAMIAGKMTGTGFAPYVLTIRETGKIWFVAYKSNQDSIVLQSANAMALNTWTHLACVRDGGTLRLFVNGVQEASDATLGASTLLYGSASDPLMIGNYSTADNRIITNAHIDEFRFTKGVARYKSNFTPPSSAFPNSV